MAVVPSPLIDPIKRKAAFFIGHACEQVSVRPIVESASSPEDFRAALLRLETRLREETRSSEVLWPVLEILANPSARHFVSQVREGGKRAESSKRAKTTAQSLKGATGRIWTLAEPTPLHPHGRLAEEDYKRALAVVLAHARAPLAAGEYDGWKDHRRKGVADSDRSSVETSSRSTAFGELVLMPLLRVIRGRDPHKNIRDSEVAVLVFEVLHSYFPTPVTKKLTANAIRTRLFALSVELSER